MFNNNNNNNYNYIIVNYYKFLLVKYTDIYQKLKKGK